MLSGHHHGNRGGSATGGDGDQGQDVRRAGRVCASRFRVTDQLARFLAAVQGRHQPGDAGAHQDFRGPAGRRTRQGPGQTRVIRRKRKPIPRRRAPWPGRAIDQAQAGANSNLARARASAGQSLKAKADSRRCGYAARRAPAATPPIDAASGADNYIRQIDAQSKLRWNSQVPPFVLGTGANARPCRSSCRCRGPRSNTNPPGAAGGKVSSRTHPSMKFAFRRFGGCLGPLSGHGRACQAFSTPHALFAETPQERRGCRDERGHDGERVIDHIRICSSGPGLPSWPRRRDPAVSVPAAPATARACAPGPAEALRSCQVHPAWSLAAL